MAAPACPTCGNVNPPGTDKCLKCGTALPSEFKTSICPNCKNVNPVGTLQCVKCGHELPENLPIPLIINKAEEKKGLNFVKYAGIVVALGAILIYAFPIVTWAYYGYQLYGIASFPPPSNVLVPPVPHGFAETLQAIILGGFALLGIGWIFFGLAFRSFSAVDPGYKSTMFSAFIGVISVVLIAAAGVINISASTDYINCLNSNPGNTAICTVASNTAYTIYWLWAFSIMFFIFGGIGVFIGLFRLGARYLTPAYWIAGFLMIFPILVLIGAIALIFAAVGSEKRLESWEKFGVRDVSSAAVVPPAAG